MEFVAGGRELGRITIELRADIVPICAENVRQLCTGERGKSRKTGVTLHYKGSIGSREYTDSELYIRGGYKAIMKKYYHLRRSGKRKSND